MKRRFSFRMGRVHVAPNRDWSLYLDLWGFQLELNVALPPQKSQKVASANG
jgi:hypothetical protein